MKIWEIILVFLMGIILIFGLYVLWFNLPRSNINFEEYNPDIIAEVQATSSQFYPNMRFRDKKISYSIEPDCRNGRIVNIQEALSSISEKTVLEFYNTDDGEIKFLCSQVAPLPEERNHFVAGEGGPTKIVNATKFSVIYEAEVSLFRSEKCDKPQIATHEILHAIGFDHNNNKSSIMYPITECSQIIDQYIIEEIDRLYSFGKNPDLAITYLEANRSGRYINFEVGVSNVGLEETKNSILTIYADKNLVKKFDLGKINIGERKTYTVTNARGPSNFDKLIFEVSLENDLDGSNNRVELATKA